MPEGLGIDLTQGLPANQKVIPPSYARKQMMLYLQPMMCKGLSRKFFSLITSIVFFIPSFSQTEKTITGTIRFDFMVPQPIANGAFKKSFTGILDLGTGVYMNIKQFSIGLNGRYKQFQVHANKINNTVTTMENIYNGGISLGYDYFRNETTLLTPGLNIGYNWIQFNHITCIASEPGQHNFNAVNLEPYFKINWMIDDGFGIGLMASYNLMAIEFNPDLVCLNEFKTYNEGDYKGLTQSFSFGFCAYWNWAERPKSEY